MFGFRQMLDSFIYFSKEKTLQKNDNNTFFWYNIRKFKKRVELLRICY